MPLMVSIQPWVFITTCWSRLGSLFKPCLECWTFILLFLTLKKIISPSNSLGCPAATLQQLTCVLFVIFPTSSQGGYSARGGVTDHLDKYDDLITVFVVILTWWVAVIYIQWRGSSSSSSSSFGPLILIMSPITSSHYDDLYKMTSF